MGTLILTGAGISLASGIPTFRGTDPNAVWANDVKAKATLSYFHQNPVGSWLFYLERFARYMNAEPNDAHKALAEWERKTSDFLLVTQNVDTLHEKAGSQRLVKVHGSRDRMRCSRDGCQNGAPHGTIPFDLKLFMPMLDEPEIEMIPRCEICSALLRPHVLWFDEYYVDHASYQWELVKSWAESRATEVWLIGTSNAVTVADVLLRTAWEREIPVHVVNPGGEDVPGAIHHRENAETWLPTYVQGLAA